MGPLQGLRFVEMAGIGPGPFCGMLLADLGAEVLVVDREGAGQPFGADPRRDLTRRGKQSIALDLKQPGAAEVVLRLVERADGLIEGYRPGVMERLGLGPDDCLALNPRLIYGRMTGWGQDGPLAHAAGHDMNYIGVSGALWYSSLPGQPPFASPTLVGDIGGGALYLVVGMLAGILNARSTGKGTVVDAAIVDGSAHMMNLMMSLAGSGMLSYERGGSLLDGPHWSRSYRTSDGGFMSVQCLEPKFYGVFLELLGLSEDPQFKRQFDRALWPQLCLRLEGIFAGRTQAEWTALFEGTDACVASILDPSKAAEHPHMKARDIWYKADGLLQAAPAPRFSGVRADVPPIPQRGQHSDEIRREALAQALA